jgi:hypothetical protein
MRNAKLTNVLLTFELLFRPAVGLGRESECNRDEEDHFNHKTQQAIGKLVSRSDHDWIDKMSCKCKRNINTRKTMTLKVLQMLKELSTFAISTTKASRLS